MEYYSESILEVDIILNREKYKGRGRPRNSDYTNAIALQKKLNKEFNNYLDNEARTV